MISAPARTLSFKIVLAALISAAALFAAFQAEAQVKGDQWNFSITPYLWLPNVNGTLKYSIPPGGGGSPEVGVGPADWLEALKFAMMLAGEARKGRWAIFTDIIYLDLESNHGTVKAVDFGLTARNPLSTSLDAGTQSSLKGGLWELAGSYTAVEGDIVTLDVLGGFRYFSIRASTDWRLTAAVSGPEGGRSFPTSGSISQGDDLWDGIVGVRGKIRLGRSNWSLPYYLDIGTGSSDFTWQGMAGIAYGWSWGSVQLVYRHLYYDQKNDKLLQDMRFDGPALGISFRF
jgi:hypothetical protein